jgi:hypothetical protein
VTALPGRSRRRSGRPPRRPCHTKGKIVFLAMACPFCNKFTGVGLRRPGTPPTSPVRTDGTNHKYRAEEFRWRSSVPCPFLAPLFDHSIIRQYQETNAVVRNTLQIAPSTNKCHSEPLVQQMLDGTWVRARRFIDVMVGTKLGLTRDAK